MNTASTRRKPNRRTRRKPKYAEIEPESRDVDISDRTWRIAAIAILIVAAILRLYDLGLVPLHHDEGVNGNFLVHLVRDGAYQYDPANYHGPTLYYFAAFIPWILRVLGGKHAQETYGLTTVTIRLIPALFGLGTIGLIYLLRRNIGSIATLAAALLLALSPGAVYLSRYFIHETLFTFFSLGTVVASLKFYEDRKPLLLVLAAISAALLFATKETAMISAAVLIIALVLTPLYQWLFIQVITDARRSTSQSIINGFRKLISELGGTINFWAWIAAAIVVFLVVNIIFYSSFFTNYPKGIYDALKTFQFWTKTGKEAHVHAPGTYLIWLVNQEGALFGLAVIGAAIAVLRPRNTFLLFSAMWAFGLLVAYSLVPYKTPWLTLNFIVPFAIVAGHAIQSLYDLERTRWLLPGIAMAIAVAIGGYQMIDLNFFNYDNDNPYYVYVYAHTKRGTLKLVDEINRIAQQRHEDGRIGITIVSPDYWPLPWYLRNYSRVGYYARMTPTTEPVIIASESQKDEVESTFGEMYQQVRSDSENGSFGLRPGVDLRLYVRRN
ncbi:MAG: flippase activity-associated protein Agl23 [Pyrinomonadaceae bacterium]